MNRQLKNQKIESQDDLRTKIRSYFEGEPRAPAQRTVQQWAEDWWEATHPDQRRA
jgi:hypothetical protein